MSKEKRPKLGRRFRSILDNDNEIFHNDIFNRFVSSDNYFKKMEAEPGHAKIPKDRQTVNSFIWFKSERCSGLARACELWNEGMIIETTVTFPPKTRIYIEAAHELKIESTIAYIVNCTQKEAGIYVSELKI